LSASVNTLGSKKVNKKIVVIFRVRDI